MSTAVIRPLAPADVEQVGDFARRVWLDAYIGIIAQDQIDYMLEQRYNPKRILAELQKPGIWWDLALIDGELAAFASTLLTDNTGEMKLDKLYVDPARQRHGLGGQLIAHVSERAVRIGCRTLILAVNKHNQRAIAAYKKHGFTVREAVEVDIGNGFVMDDFIMAKALRAT